jgi:hypothetical protein
VLAPALLYECKPQAVHVPTTVVDLYVPARHCLHALVPVMMYVPIGHVVEQTLAPAMLYLPVLQGEQKTVPTPLYVPAGQIVQTLAPAALYVPALHALQVATDVAPTAVLNLPAKQFMQSLANVFPYP